VKNGEKTTDEIISLFHKELRLRYTVNEIRTILYHLFDYLSGWSRATLILNRGKILDDRVLSGLFDALKRLNRGEPVQYITGSAEFCGLVIKVGPGVLIPRPETEELAALIIRENQSLRNNSISILDIGSGSGCLALALKNSFPNAQVTGIEKYHEALLFARQNAEENQLQVTFTEDDIFNPRSFNTSSSFEIIVSNPPYIPHQERKNLRPHVADYEPEYALFVPNDQPLLFYNTISLFAKDHLKPKGKLYVEIHEYYGEECEKMFRTHGFKTVYLIKDMYGKNRFITASKSG
jgi:release factor glutamine methyltransferase